MGLRRPVSVPPWSDEVLDEAIAEVDDGELCAVFELVAQLYLQRNPLTLQLVAGATVRNWQEVESKSPFITGTTGSEDAQRLLRELVGQLEAAE